MYDFKQSFLFVIIFTFYFSLIASVEHQVAEPSTKLLHVKSILEAREMRVKDQCLKRESYLGVFSTESAVDCVMVRLRGIRGTDENGNEIDVDNVLIRMDADKAKAMDFLSYLSLALKKSRSGRGVRFSPLQYTEKEVKSSELTGNVSDQKLVTVRLGRIQAYEPAKGKDYPEEKIADFGTL